MVAECLRPHHWAGVRRQQGLADRLAAIDGRVGRAWKAQIAIGSEVYYAPAVTPGAGAV